MGCLYGIMVQCRTNITWQFIGVETQRCQCRESSNLTGNRACRRVQNCSTVSTWPLRLHCMNDSPVKELLRKDRYESVWFSGNNFVIASPMSPTKITRLVCCDMSFNGIFVLDSGTMSCKSYLRSHWRTAAGMSVPWELQSHWESDLQKSSKRQ